MQTSRLDEIPRAKRVDAFPAAASRCAVTTSPPPYRGRSRCRVRAWSAVMLLLALLASGCTRFTDYVNQRFKVGPEYARAPAPVAEHWIDEYDKHLSSEDWDDSHWWAVFGDPVLNELVESAYHQNLTLREAGFRVLQARADLGKTIGNFFPQTQEVGGSYTNNGLSNNVANRQFVPQKFYTQWNVGFSVAWELDFWGRYRRAIEASEGELNASIEEYDAVLVTLVADVAQSYVQLRQIEQQLEYVRANVELQKETLGIATARFKGGLVSELDVDQAQSLLSQTEAQVPQLEIQRRIVQNRLCFLLGMPTVDMNERLKSAPIPTAPPQIAVGIPAELLRRRPDVRRLERIAAAQSARIGVAESDFYPAVSIGGTAGYTALNFSNLLEGSSFEGSGGPSFDWKVLNYGRILNTVRFHKARFQEYVTRYQNAVLAANEEVEDGLVQFLLAHEEAQFLAESVRAAEKAVQVSMTQYQAGLVDFNRVALLEQNLVQQQDLFAQAYSGIALGLVQTYRALGGGWQIRLDGNDVLPDVKPPPLPDDAPGAPGLEVVPLPEAPPPADIPPPAAEPPAPPLPPGQEGAALDHDDTKADHPANTVADEGPSPRASVAMARLQRALAPTFTAKSERSARSQVRELDDAPPVPPVSRHTGKPMRYVDP